MNILMIIFGFLSVLAGIIVPIIIQYNINENTRYGETPKKAKRTAWTVMLLAGIMLFMIGHSFEIIPTGYTGVRVMMGQISETTVSNGFNLKVPMVEDIVQINNKLQDTEIKSEVWGETSEKTPVYATDIVVSYQILGNKAAWLYANVDNVDNLIDDKLVASAVKSAMVELTVENVTNRSYIEPLVLKKLNESLIEKYGEDAVIAKKIVINNMDFEASYNEAIAAKSIAAQNQARQEIENMTNIAKAAADKEIALTNAQAAAEAKKIQAEADAAALLIAAEAEAEANKKIAESLTDEVIENKKIDKWDGKLPTVTGDNGTIIDIGTTTP